MNYILLKELMKQSETECGFDSNKFAELIVRECVAIIQTEVGMKYKDGWEQHGVSDDWATGHYNASLHSRALLKRHFGVEE